MEYESYLVYNDGTLTEVHPDLVEGGKGWYFVDEQCQVHGTYKTKKEARDEEKEWYNPE